MNRCRGTNIVTPLTITKWPSYSPVTFNEFIKWQRSDKRYVASDGHAIKETRVKNTARINQWSVIDIYKIVYARAYTMPFVTPL